MLALALLTATLGTTPNDAVGWAIAHQLSVPPETRPFFRYVLLADYMIPPDSGWDERHAGQVCGVRSWTLFFMYWMQSNTGPVKTSLPVLSIKMILSNILKILELG